MSKTAKTPVAAKNVAIVPAVKIRPDLIQRVRFVQRIRPNGQTVNLVKSRGLPKLIVRRLNAKEVIGHVSGDRATVIATGTSERSVFEALVTKVWNSKAAKQAWHPTAA